MLGKIRFRNWNFSILFLKEVFLKFKERGSMLDLQWRHGAVKRKNPSFLQDFGSFDWKNNNKNGANYIKHVRTLQQII